MLSFRFSFIARYTIHDTPVTPPPLIFYVFVARIESTNDPHLSQTLLFLNKNKNHSQVFVNREDTDTLLSLVFVNASSYYEQI